MPDIVCVMQSVQYLVADLDDGGVRVGWQGGKQYDVPVGHRRHTEARLLFLALDFDDAVEQFLDRIDGTCAYTVQT